MAFLHEYQPCVNNHLAKLLHKTVLFSLLPGEDNTYAGASPELFTVRIGHCPLLITLSKFGKSIHSSSIPKLSRFTISLRRSVCSSHTSEPA